MQGLFSRMFFTTNSLFTVGGFDAGLGVVLWVEGWEGEQKITDYLLSVIKNAFIRRQLAFV